MSREYKIECWKCDNGKGARGYIKGPDFDMGWERKDTIRKMQMVQVFCNHCTAEYIALFDEGTNLLMYEWIGFGWGHLHKLQREGRMEIVNGK